MNDTINIEVTPADGWKLITTATAGVFSGTSSCLYYFGTMAPTNIVAGHRLDNGDTELFLLNASESLWVRSSTRINIVLSFAGTGLFTRWFKEMLEGKQAVTMQSYLESNSKLGLQHEGSAVFPNVAAGAYNYTVFETGALPVILKARIVSYTGEGISAEIYRDGTYTGGTLQVYQNASDINPVEGLTKIYTGVAVDTLGTLVFAPDVRLGNQSIQGRGSHGLLVGNEHVLRPLTRYLLALKSMNTTGNQTMTSYLTWFEGLPDRP